MLGVVSHMDLIACLKLYMPSERNERKTGIEPLFSVEQALNRGARRRLGTESEPTVSERGKVLFFSFTVEN